MARSIYNKKSEFLLTKILKPKIAIFSLIFVIIFRIFLFNSFTITDSATFSVSDSPVKNYKVVYLKYLFPLFKPKRGDVILYRYATQKNSYKSLISSGRVCGLPGEKLRIKDKKVLINGKVLNDEKIIQNQYLTTKKMSFIKAYSKKTIPKQSYYILGDNSISSYDSRYLGSIQKNDIIGKIVLIYWPFNKLNLL